MKEKLLALLKTKFQGVDDAILDRIATKKAEGVTDEAQLPAVMEGIGFQDVLTSYGDFRAGDASVKAVSNYEKKHNIKDGKPIGQPATGDGQINNEPAKPFDAEALKADMLKALREEMAAAAQQEQQKVQRAAAIASKAKEFGIPEKFAAKFNIAQGVDLDEYFKSVKQEMADAGFEFSEPPAQGGGMTDNGNDIAKLINTGTEQIVKSQNK